MSTTKRIPAQLRGEFPQGEREYSRRNERYKATGEFRCPLKGEYYLSGSPVEAYCTPNDLSSSYWIAVRKENS